MTYQDAWSRRETAAHNGRIRRSSPGANRRHSLRRVVCAKAG